jgi:cytochrome c oxidase assembly protein subunit 15
MNAVPSLRLHRTSIGVAAFAAFVIFVGAMVTSTGSGMSVPDWPQSFGTWTPAMKGGVFYEHGHRVVAGALAVFVAALAFWAAYAERRTWARALTWTAFVAVLAQAALGGLTVLTGTYFSWDHTDPTLSALHAMLAQAVLAALVAYAAVSAPGWRVETRGRASKSAVRWAWALALLVYLQIVLGAVLRHQSAGLVIFDFPLNYGRIIPPFYTWLVALNFAHRVGGWLLACGGSWLSARLVRDPSLDPWARRPAALFLGAVVVQFFLGAGAVWTRLTWPWLTSLHVLGGSLLLGTSVVLALRITRLAGPDA